MKKNYASLLFIILSITGIAQDTLFTKDGKTINGKVLEVGKYDVKFKSPANAEQLSVIALSDITRINYENGSSDTFSDMTTTLPEPTVNNKDVARQYEKNRRTEAAIDAVIIGARVIGFILRVALDVALAGQGHSSHGIDHHSSGTNRPRGH